LPRVQSAEPTSNEIAVLIADDQQLVRVGFKLIIEGEPDMAVIGEARDGLEALDLASKRAPDVVRLDIRMPGMDGLTAARRIIDETDCRVLLLTTFDADRSNAEIAAELVVEESTVKSHVGRILMKLGLRDRIQAVVLAYESGFVTPDLLGRWLSLRQRRRSRGRINTDVFMLAR
jgi:DNA-binding NarL/FixJ family response regulator